MVVLVCRWLWLLSAFIGLKVAVANLPSWPVWLLFILDAAFKYGLFGIIPVILFIIGGLKLSCSKKRKKNDIVYAKSFVFIYGRALLLFVSSCYNDVPSAL